jgi:hypothetical protein
LLQILVAELNATRDTPVELGMAKIASMCQIAASDAHDSHADEGAPGGQKGVTPAKQGGSKASYASQHRTVQIQGLASLDIS